MVGNRVYAEMAFNDELELLSTLGSARTVFWSGGDVVYKVENLSGRENRINRREWCRYQELITLDWSDRIGIPKTSIYDIGGISVIAMQHIGGIEIGECFCERKCKCTNVLPADVWQELWDNGITDLGYNNVRLWNGRYWPIDLEM